MPAVGYPEVHFSAGLQGLITYAMPLAVRGLVLCDAKLTFPSHEYTGSLKAQRELWESSGLKSETRMPQVDFFATYQLVPQLIGCRIDSILIWKRLSTQKA
jgi:hypothetical protein